MSSDITQTPLFQNMLLQHVCFYLLKLTKHPSLSQRSGQQNPTVLISTMSKFQSYAYQRDMGGVEKGSYLD